MSIRHRDITIRVRYLHDEGDFVPTLIPRLDQAIEVWSEWRNLELEDWKTALGPEVVEGPFDTGLEGL